MRWQDDDGKRLPFKRLNVKLPVAVHTGFRDAAAVDGRPMQVILVDLVKRFTKEAKEKQKK